MAELPAFINSKFGVSLCSSIHALSVAIASSHNLHEKRWTLTKLIWSSCGPDGASLLAAQISIENMFALEGGKKVPISEVTND